jgi:hypothetical protein
MVCDIELAASPSGHAPGTLAHTGAMSIFRAAFGFLLLVGATQTGCFPSELRDRHASTVETFLLAPFLPEDAPYADPERALGPPDGRTVALGTGAYVVLRFFRPIPNAPGPDLRVYEVGPDGARARLAASEDGVHFVELSDTLVGPTQTVDLDELGIDNAAFIRIRGVDDAGDDPGFDLDAVEALN